VTESEWRESTHLFGLLEYAYRKVSGRRLLSYALFWVDQTRHLLPDRLGQRVDHYRALAADPTRSVKHASGTNGASRALNFASSSATEHAIDAAEELLHGDWVTAVLVSGRAIAQDRVYGPRVAPSHAQPAHELRVRFWAAADRVVSEQLFSLRCALGNPFRSPVCAPQWLTSTVLALAQVIDAGDLSALPILADALQEAGCDNEEVLNHCRGPGPHLCGCWVANLVLGKQFGETL
jgi:hypothetical protein